MEVLGAAAGAAALLYLLGGVIFAARLHALDLPIDAAVALLPKSALLVAGVRALALALVLAGTVALLIRALDPIRATGWRRVRVAVSIFLAFAAVTGPTALPVLLEPLTKWQRAVLIVLAVVAVVAVVAAVLSASSYRTLAYQLAAVVLVLGTLLRTISELLPPTPMDFVSVRLADGNVTDGFYLAADASTVFLAPNVGGRTIGTVTAIPRDDIVALRLRRERNPNVRPLGADLPAAIVGPLSGPSALSGVRKQRRDEIASYAAQLRLHPGFRFPPVVPVNALAFLLDHYSAFAQHRAHPFPKHHERIPIATVLAHPQDYVGQGVVTDGVLASDVPARGGAGNRRTIRVRAASSRTSEASCTLSTSRPFKAGTRVELYATVVAWGDFNIRAGKPMRETVLACAAVRPLRDS